MTTVTYPHIAFIGRAGAGKTTAAELLAKHFGYERLSFAAPLKVMCGTTTDRSLLQRVGMEVRALVEDGWVNLLVEEFYRGDAPRPPAVIDDARFHNEVVRLRMEGFITVRVRAHEALRVMRLKANGKLQDESQLNHPSETALDDFQTDYTVENGGDPDVLLEQLVNIIDREQR